MNELTVSMSRGSLLTTAQAEQPIIYSGSDLDALVFPTVLWAVEGLLPPGVTVIAGRPKSGKSWLALNLAAGVATGSMVLGDVDVAEGDVLVLALEDTPRRVQARLRRIMQGHPLPSAFHVATRWRRLDGGGLEDLREWLAAHPAARLVVVDTLGFIWPDAAGDTAYRRDYSVILALKEIADDYGVSLVGVHHQRKSGAADFIDTIAGSVGLTGAADALIVLDRRRNSEHGVLRVVGRDVEGYEQPVVFDTETGSWATTGPDQGPVEARALVPLESQILHLLSETDDSLTPARIATLLTANPNTVRGLLSRLKDQGKIRRVARGQYTKNMDGGNGEWP